MKMILKKHGFLAAALLVTAVLVTSCLNPQDPSGAFEPAYRPPEGMGAVRVSINNTVSRAIMPDTDPDLWEAEDLFESYRLIITYEGPMGTAHVKTINDMSEIFDTIEIEMSQSLNEFTYDFELIAFADDSHANVFAREKKSVLIKRGEVTTVTFSLKVADPSENTAAQGRFSWAIRYLRTPEEIPPQTPAPLPFDPESAQMSIRPIGGAISTPSPTNISSVSTGVPSGVMPLAEGYYWVDFRVGYGGSTITLTQVLHIYRYLTSPFSYDFIGTHFAVPEGTGAWIGSTGNIDVIIPPDTTPPILSTGHLVPLPLNLTGASNRTLDITVDNIATGAYKNEDDALYVEWYLNGHNLDQCDCGVSHASFVDPSSANSRRLILDGNPTNGTALGLQSGKIYPLSVVVMEDIGGGVLIPHIRIVSIRIGNGS